MCHTTRIKRTLPSLTSTVRLENLQWLTEAMGGVGAHNRSMTRPSQLLHPPRQTAPILNAATDLRQRFWLACVVFGGWVGLVIGVKLISLPLPVTRIDFEPDRGACLACARCFRSCPQELVRLGEKPAISAEVAT